MTKDENKNELEKVSFEAAIKELTDIVAKIEQGQISLESSLSQYERGMDLIRHCRGILGQAQKRIEKISEQGELKGQ